MLTAKDRLRSRNEGRKSVRTNTSSTIQSHGNSRPGEDLSRISPPMQDTGNKMLAQKIFERGSALLQQQKYEQALVDLQQAEQLFRKIDVRGHPFTIPLSNGVSGLANALALSGLCYLKQETFARPPNAMNPAYQFQVRKDVAFQKVLKTVNENLLSCYEALLRSKRPEDLEKLLKSDPEMTLPMSSLFAQ